MKRSKAFTILFLVVLLILSGCGNAMDSFASQVTQGYYSKAIDIYKKSIAGNSSLENECESFLNNYLEENWEKYASGKASETEFNDVLTTLQRLNGELSLFHDLDNVLMEYEAVKSSKEYYAEGEQLAEEGDYLGAFRSFTQVLPEDSENFATAMSRSEDMLTAYQTEIISRAAELADGGAYEEARVLVTEAEYLLGPTEELEKLMSELYTRPYAEAIEAADRANNYAEVIRQYALARDNSYVVISADMTGTYSSSVAAFLNELFGQAQSAFGNGKNYSAAIDILRSAFAEVNMDEAVCTSIDNEIASYLEYVPVALSSLEYTQIGEYIRVGARFKDEYTDVNGVVYNKETVIHPTGGSLASQSAKEEDDAYVTYNLNMKYSTLSGVLYRPYRSLSSTGEWSKNTTVKIYGDGVLLYEAPNITQDTYDTVLISVDVSGVRNLKIVMMGVWGESSGWIGLYDIYPKVCLAELMLQK